MFRQLVGGIVFLVALGVALQVSVAGSMRARYPQVALEWMPFDAIARAELASSLAASKSPEALDSARQLAIDSVRRTPLNPAALRSLGLALDQAGPADDARVAAIMREAERLSRRDLPTQQWLIQRHIRDGDLQGGMRKIDTALRTSSSRRDTLFALMAGASADPAFAREVSNRMASRPEWASGFMSYLVASGQRPEQSVYFARNFLDATDASDLQIARGLLQQLSALRRYDLAWDIFTRFGLNRQPGGATSSGVVDGTFDDPDGFVPFAWSLAEDADLWAVRQRDPGDDSGLVLGVGAHSGRAGEVARQLVRLSPGTYRLRSRVAGVAADRFERPEIRVQCAQEGGRQPLLSLRPGAPGGGVQALAGQFTVPSGCPFQWIAIAIAGDGPPSEQVTWLDDIEIERTSG